MRQSTRSYPIVGVGASAGGFEAFRELLQALPADSGLAFVLVQHLDPHHESMLSRLLVKSTAMPITEVKDGMAVEPNHVYVIPPNTTMSVRDGVLHLIGRGSASAKHMPIDYFLRSLAEDQGSRAVGVILSGTASDGTWGMKAIKAEGGITFAQDEKSAKYDGMPRSAIAAGCVDFVLPPEEIAKELASIGRHPYLGTPGPAKTPELPEEDDHLSRVFVALRNATGVDFTHYKYNTIRRRIARRMVLHKISDPKDYVKYLHRDPSELEALYQDILIHVTGFFREPESFDALKERVFPALINSTAPGEPIRIWVPGCSTGEEVYSIAITLLECLDRKADNIEIQFFGTDISEPAIEKARAGIYTDHDLVDVSPERLRRFFATADGGRQITKSLREMCVFARQDLAKDAPFSRLDFISCRNVLIYMGPVLQKKILGIFHYALKLTGFLMLGKSESITGFSDLFSVADRKNKIYSKKATKARPILDFTAAHHEHVAREAAVRGEDPARFDVQKAADRLVLSRYVPAGLIVNDALQILHFRGHTNPYLSPAAGEASLSLLQMVRPELAVEIRTAIYQARKQDGLVRKEGIRIRQDGAVRDVDLDVMLILGSSGERYFLISFEEPSNRKPAEPKALKRTVKPDRVKEPEAIKLRRELETTKEYLQSIIEEQEATNEELKSANEEVLSSDEELQSTNEELETAKEELQSTNEELVTVNEQLQNRNAELGQLSDDLTNLLGSVNIPIVMLSSDRRIRRFTPTAEKLLNLVPSDVGRPLSNFKPNVNVPDLEPLIAEVMDSITVQEREVQDLKGRWYSMRIRPYKTLDNRIDGVVILFIQIDALKRSRDALREEGEFVSAVLDTAPALVVVTDREDRIVQFNRACQQVSGYSLDEVKGKTSWDQLVPPEEVEAVRNLYREIGESHLAMENESHWVAKDGRRRLIAWSSIALRDADGRVKNLIRAGVDITERHEAEQAAREAQEALRRSQAELRALTAGLLTAQEEERRRVSRELHDDLNQKLAMLSVEVETLEKRLPDSAGLLPAKLQLLRQRAADLSDGLRRIAYQLHPSTLEHLGLGAALKAYCADFTKLEGVRIKFRQRNVPDSVGPAEALCLYRITQEALRNVAKHSGAQEAWVSLAGTDKELHLYIGDSGRGFDKDRPNLRRGLGLVSMEERVRLVNGAFSIESKPGGGVRIDIRVPLKRAEQEKSAERASA